MPVYPTQSVVLVKPQDMPDTYCVYTHTVMSNDPDSTPDALIFIGVSKLTEVYRYTDAQANSEWARRVPSGHWLNIGVVAVGTRAECMNHRRALVMQYRPVCNVSGHDIRSSTTLIECVENGVTYQSQSEAAAALGVAQSSISAHLSGRKGFERVKGMTFKRKGATL